MTEHELHEAESKSWAERLGRPVLTIAACDKCGRMEFAKLFEKAAHKCTRLEKTEPRRGGGYDRTECGGVIR